MLSHFLPLTSHCQNIFVKILEIIKSEDKTFYLLVTGSVVVKSVTILLPIGYPHHKTLQVLVRPKCKQSQHITYSPDWRNDLMISEITRLKELGVKSTHAKCSQCCTLGIYYLQ